MRKLTRWLLPVFGFLFITAYIRSATVDVVYTDYIRQINAYLPDVFSFRPYLHADILARIPVTYFVRIINVALFKYSTTFDMILGALGLAASAWIIGTYAYEKKMSAAVIAVLMLIIFSLDKWEMLTNGTGWVHFWSFACFYYHYLIYDRVRCGKGKKNDELRLCIIPAITILFISGQYCPIYVGSLALVYLADYLMKSDKSQAFYALIRDELLIIAPFLLFCIGYVMSPAEYAGAANDSFIGVMTSEPLLGAKMILKSFGSMVIGGETAAEWGIQGKYVCLLGFIVILGYAYAIYLNIKSGLYKTTSFPMLLILSGLISHGIVFVTRWIFKSDDYMMSSRYALQFQSGILGIILTFTMVDKKNIIRPAVTAFIILILLGHLCTTGREIRIAKYRKENFQNMYSTALNYKNENDETLKKIFQYHDPEKTRDALRILEDNNWNVYRK